MIVKTNVTAGDKVFDVINFLFLTIVMLLVLYPIYFIAIASVSSPEGISQAKVWLLPYQVSFDGYRRIFNDAMIWTGYLNSIIYVVLGTAINLAVTLPAGYVLSRKELIGKKFFMQIFVFTMFFSGGLIPTYLLVKDLGMVDKICAMVIPNALEVFNLIITRTFYSSSFPDELQDAGKIDGCTNIRFFLSIVLPLSYPVIMVMLLFYGEYHWNSYFDALIYLRSQKLYPLQIILRNILTKNEISMMSSVSDIESIVEQQRVVEQIKYGLFLVSSLPLLIVYPFIQQYFEKGIMIGAVKG